MVFTSFFTLPMISIDFPLSRLIGLKDVKESIRHTRNFIEVQPGNPETPETSDSRPSQGPKMEKIPTPTMDLRNPQETSQQRHWRCFGPQFAFRLHAGHRRSSELVDAEKFPWTIVVLKGSGAGKVAQVLGGMLLKFCLSDYVNETNTGYSSTFYTFSNLHVEVRGPFFWSCPRGDPEGSYRWLYWRWCLCLDIFMQIRWFVSQIQTKRLKLDDFVAEVDAKMKKVVVGLRLIGRVKDILRVGSVKMCFFSAVRDC